MTALAPWGETAPDPSVTAPEIAAYATEEYVRELTTRMATTVQGDKVVLATMSFSPDERAVGALMEVATEAARRGVDVRVGIDAFSFMFDTDDKLTGPLFMHGTLTTTNPYYADKLAAMCALETAGGKATVLNIPKHRLSLPHAGRSHIKGAVILPGNTDSPTKPWYALGGVNLEHLWFNDLMVGGSSPDVANTVHELLCKIIEHGNVRDALGDDDLRIDTNGSQLLVDVGVHGQSTILEEAVAIVDRAEEWVVTSSQYPPSGPLASALARAHARDVRTFPIHNHSENSRLGGHVMALFRAANRLRLPGELFQYHLGPEDEFMHAKVVASEKGVLVSSHNGVRTGVTIGTAEMGIAHQDPEVAKTVVRKLLARIAWQDRTEFGFAQLARPEAA